MGPRSYGPLEHGGMLFPDLLGVLTDGVDPYKLCAIARRVLCKSVRHAGLACDPALCRRALRRSLAEALATDHPEASWGWRCRERYRAYRAEDDARTEAGKPRAAFADVLAGLGLDG